MSRIEEVDLVFKITLLSDTLMDLEKTFKWGLGVQTLASPSSVVPVQ